MEKKKSVRAASPVSKCQKSPTIKSYRPQTSREQTPAKNTSRRLAKCPSTAGLSRVRPNNKTPAKEDMRDLSNDIFHDQVLLELDDSCPKPTSSFLKLCAENQALKLNQHLEMRKRYHLSVSGEKKFPSSSGHTFIAQTPERSNSRRVSHMRPNNVLLDNFSESFLRDHSRDNSGPALPTRDESTKIIFPNFLKENRAPQVMEKKIAEVDTYAQFFNDLQDYQQISERLNPTKDLFNAGSYLEAERPRDYVKSKAHNESVKPALFDLKIWDNRENTDIANIFPEDLKKINRERSSKIGKKIQNESSESRRFGAQNYDAKKSEWNVFSIQQLMMPNDNKGSISLRK